MLLIVDHLTPVGLLGFCFKLPSSFCDWGNVKTHPKVLQLVLYVDIQYLWPLIGCSSIQLCPAVGYFLLSVTAICATSDKWTKTADGKSVRNLTLVFFLILQKCSVHGWDGELGPTSVYEDLHRSMRVYVCLRGSTKVCDTGEELQGARTARR